jgi:hypothetical protein
MVCLIGLIERKKKRRKSEERAKKELKKELKKNPVSSSTALSGGIPRKSLSSSLEGLLKRENYKGFLKDFSNRVKRQKSIVRIIEFWAIAYIVGGSFFPQYVNGLGYINRTATYVFEKVPPLIDDILDKFRNKNPDPKDSHDEAKSKVKKPGGKGEKGGGQNGTGNSASQKHQSADEVGDGEEQIVGYLQEEVNYEKPRIELISESNYLNTYSEIDSTTQFWDSDYKLKSPFMDVTSILLQKKNEEIRPGSRLDQYTYTSVELSTPIDWIIRLPTLEGTELDSVFIYSPKWKTADVVDRIYFNQQTGVYFAKVKLQFAKDKLEISGHYSRRRGWSRLRLDQTKVLDEFRYHWNVDSMDVASMSEDLRGIGEKYISAVLLEMSQKKTPVNFEKLAKIISTESRYKIDRSKPTKMATIPDFKPFLKDGRFEFKCDQANTLLIRLIRRYIQTSSIHVGLVYSLVRKASDQPGLWYITTISHGRVMITDENFTGHLILDATPPTYADGEKKEDGGLRSMVDLDVFKKLFEKKKSEKNRRKLDVIPLEATLPNKYRYRTKSYSEEELLELEEFHQSKVARLSGLLDKIEKLETFETQVRSRTELPAVAVYRLGRQVLSFAVDELTLEELLTTIREKFYLKEDLPPPISQVIVLLEAQVLKEMKHYESIRGQSSRARNLLNISAADPNLNEQIRNLLVLLKSYDWQSVRADLTEKKSP